jgi:hypothetical protein
MFFICGEFAPGLATDKEFSFISVAIAEYCNCSWARLVLSQMGIAGQINCVEPAYGLRSQFRHAGGVTVRLHHRYHSDVWTGEQGQKRF